MSYNVLADEYKENQQYDTHEDYMDPIYRSDLIIKEIKFLDPDIIAL